MGGPRINDDDKPAANQFGLPIVCGRDLDAYQAGPTGQPIDRKYFRGNLVTSVGSDAIVGLKTAAGEIVDVLSGDGDTVTGWFLCATASSTSNAKAAWYVINDLDSLAGSTATVVEFDFAYGGCRYVVVDFINWTGAETKSLYLDVLNGSIVSADSGLTATVEPGALCGHRFRVTLTTAATPASVDLEVYLSSDGTTRAFSGAVNDGVFLGPWQNFISPAADAPDNVKISQAADNPVACCDKCSSLLHCLRRIPLKFSCATGIQVEDWLEIMPGTSLACNRHESLLRIYDPQGNVVDTIFTGDWIMLPVIKRAGPFPAVLPENSIDGAVIWPYSQDGYETAISNGYMHDTDLSARVDYISAHGPMHNGDGSFGSNVAVWISDGYYTLDMQTETRLFESPGLAASRIYLMMTAACYEDEGTTYIKFWQHLWFATEAGNPDCEDPEYGLFLFLWPILEGAAIAVDDDFELSDLTSLTFSTYDSNIMRDDQFFGLFDDETGMYYPNCGTGGSPIPGQTDCELCCWWDDATDRDESPVPIVSTPGCSADLVLVNCSGPAGPCEACPTLDPPDPGQAVEPVEIGFTHTMTCFMSFTAVVPDCLDVVEYFWSFGKTGATSHHLIDGICDGGSGRCLDVSLIVVDSRGCIYRYAESVSCGCPCDGASGSLTAELAPDGMGGYLDCNDVHGDSSVLLCPYLFSASVGGCETAFIELCHKEFVDYNCTDCPTLDPNPCENAMGLASCLTLGDGDTFLAWIDVGSDAPNDCWQWRVWDGACGCPGPWNYIQFQGGTNVGTCP